MTTEAFVTLATSDCYATGALVLANSLRKVGTTKKLAIMITEGVSNTIKKILQQEFDHVQLVDVFDSKDIANLKLLKRPELGVTFTKLHCWRMTQFTKAVFMDADTLVLENVDDLFEREELSAVRDPGWPDCFNSGVFVYQPSEVTYNSLMDLAITTGSYDGGDQGLLNSYFKNWGFADMRKHLPYVYNCCSSAFYSYLPALKQFASQVKVVHFIGEEKPWSKPQPSTTSDTSRSSTGLPDFRQCWWTIFREHIEDKLKAVNLNLKAGGHVTSGSHDAETGSTSSCGDASGCSAPSDQERQQQWERGHMDYTGMDRSENVLSKIKATIDTPHTSSSGSFSPTTDGERSFTPSK